MNDGIQAAIGDCLRRWGLTADGAPIVTHSSHLLPVRRGARPAMLKMAVEAEEKFGGLLMEWWDGDGAARVLAREGDALLLEWAEGTRSLAVLSRTGRDDEACRIICAAVARLHTPRNRPPPALIPLTTWFRELEPTAETHGGLLSRAAAVARELLGDRREVVPLHGDIHHGNILDFGDRGWLAIDPKRLEGERYFDYANLFCNPDHPTATRPGIFSRRVAVVSEAAGLDRRRLIAWILAWAGLSAAWLIGDGEPATTPLAVAEFAAAGSGR